VDLAQYVGKKPLLVEFWATWCPLCEALEPKLLAAHGKYGGVVEFLVVAVGVNQTPRSIRRHLEKSPMPGRVLFDAKGAAVRAFKVPTTSFIAVLDASGAVRYTGTGEDQDIDAAIRRALGR
jgi:thiol-disulfide isomerase/thioredoxin